MPRFPIIGALFISLAFIVGALWTRFGPQNSENTGLMAVIPEASTQEINVNDYFELLDAQKESKNTPAEPIELVGRQLFADYLALSSKNQNTPANVEALAEQYANALLLNNEIVPTAKIEQVKLSSDSAENFASYRQKLSQIRSRYSTLVENGGQKEFNDIFDEELLTLMGMMSTNSADAAQELMEMSVPNSLAKNHLDLINNYLSTSKAAMVISHIKDSPIAGLSAFKTLAENSQAEEALLSNIRIILLSKGLSPENI